MIYSILWKEKKSWTKIYWVTHTHTHSHSCEFRTAYLHIWGFQGWGREKSTRTFHVFIISTVSSHICEVTPATLNHPGEKHHLHGKAGEELTFCLPTEVIQSAVYVSIQGRLTASTADWNSAENNYSQVRHTHAQATRSQFRSDEIPFWKKGTTVSGEQITTTFTMNAVTTRH